MASKILFRTLLIAVLVVTAHTIKPFSFGNITLYALGAARSFSFVMPEAAVERIEHANILAQTYGKRLLDGEASIWTSEDVMRSGLVAFAAPAASFEGVEVAEIAEIKDVKSCDQDKKTSPKRPVRRIKRDATRDDDSAAKSNDIARLPESPVVETIAMPQPVDLPVYQPRVIKARFVPQSIRLAMPTLPNVIPCDKPEIKKAAQIAFVMQASKMKVELMVMPKAPVVSQCRDADVKEVEFAEEVVETTSGPEEEYFFEPAPPAAPLSLPMVEECIRIP